MQRNVVGEERLWRRGSKEPNPNLTQFCPTDLDHAVEAP